MKNAQQLYGAIDVSTGEQSSTTGNDEATARQPDRFGKNGTRLINRAAFDAPIASFPSRIARIEWASESSCTSMEGEKLAGMQEVVKN
ncbi:hypothetical protein TSMEX_003788 [Taenia solium]|eukprot:TsM_000316200 transcript=TsM_000316200 gene=TsM_000316200